MVLPVLALVLTQAPLSWADIDKLVNEQKLSQAPAAIFVGEPRHYGAVPAIGERPDVPRARVRKSS